MFGVNHFISFAARARQLHLVDAALQLPEHIQERFIELQAARGSGPDGFLHEFVEAGHERWEG